MKKTTEVWGQSSILASWMQARYIKWRAVEDIFARPSIDSAQWKELLANKVHTQKCVDYRAGNSVHWNIGNGKNNLGTITEPLRNKSHKDPPTKGFWSHMATKYSIIFGRNKNRQLKTLSTLHAWGVQVPSTCLHCGKEDETISLLFFNCEFTRSLLLKVTDRQPSPILVLPWH